MTTRSTAWLPKRITGSISSNGLSNTRCLQAGWCFFLGFWAATLLVLWLGGFAALSWRLHAREEAMRRIATTMASVLLSLSLGVGFLFSATLHRDDISHEAVILTPSAEVRNAPQVNNSLVLFILHEGTKGRILSRAGEWIELELANGSVGWVSTQQVAEV